MDDVTAEVDEREEYSNDFDEETASRGACKLSDLAGDEQENMINNGEDAHMLQEEEKQLEEGQLNGEAEDQQSSLEP